MDDSWHAEAIRCQLDTMHATISRVAYQAQPDQSAKLHAGVSVDCSAAAGQRVLQPSEAHGLPDPPAGPN